MERKDNKPLDKEAGTSEETPKEAEPESTGFLCAIFESSVNITDESYKFSSPEETPAMDIETEKTPRENDPSGTQEMKTETTDTSGTTDTNTSQVIPKKEEPKPSTSEVKRSPKNVRRRNPFLTDPSEDGSSKKKRTRYWNPFAEDFRFVTDDEDDELFQEGDYTRYLESVSIDEILFHRNIEEMVSSSDEDENKNKEEDFYRRGAQALSPEASASASSPRPCSSQDIETPLEPVGDPEEPVPDGFQIPSYIDKFVKDHPNYLEEVFQMRIVHIYDPHKFWIVIKYRELELFQELINREYRAGKFKKMSLEEAKIGKYCFVVIDQVMYRAQIVNIPSLLSPVKKLVVFLIDHGYVETLPCAYFYYMPLKYAKVVSFSVRASLSWDLCPKTNIPWSLKYVKIFYELIKDEPHFSMKIFSLCPVQNNLIIDFGTEKVPSFCRHLQALVDEDTDVNPHPSCFEPQSTPQYLLPTFSAIENEKVPKSVYITEFLRKCSPLDLLYKQVFRGEGAQEKALVINPNNDDTSDDEEDTTRMAKQQKRA